MLRVHVALLLGALALFACSKDPEPEPDAGTQETTLTPVEMCDRIAEARCNLMVRCFAAFAREPHPTCRSTEQSRCLDRYTELRPAFEEGALEIDVEKVLACEERMGSSSCPPSFPPGYAGPAVTAFSDCTLDTGLLRGKRASGDTCDDAVECEEGTVCVKPGGVCTGTCSSWSQVDEPCGFGCAPGLFCDTKGTPDPVDDRCAQPKGENAACESSTECQPDLWCNGTCQKRGAEGDPCKFDGQRLSTCAPGLACDVAPFVEGAEGTCVTPRGPNGQCRFHWTCEGGLVCFALDWSGFPDEGPPDPGACAPRVAENDPCSFTPYQIYVGDQCTGGLSCTSSGLCASRPERGQVCNAYAQNCTGQNVYCKPSESDPSLGTCTGPAAQNDRCATRLDSGGVVSIPCDTGYCDTDVTLKCLPPSKSLGQECASNGECLSGRCAVQEDRSLRCAAAC